MLILVVEDVPEVRAAVLAREVERDALEHELRHDQRVGAQRLHVELQLALRERQEVLVGEARRVLHVQRVEAEASAEQRDVCRSERRRHAQREGAAALHRLLSGSIEEDEARQDGEHDDEDQRQGDLDELLHGEMAGPRSRARGLRGLRCLSGTGGV